MGGSYVIITHGSLQFPLKTWDLTAHSSTPAGDTWWSSMRPVETCSLLGNPPHPQECWHLVSIDACTNPFRNGKMLSSKQVTWGAKRKVNKYFRHRYMEMIYDFQITFYISLICFLFFIKVVWVFNSDTIEFSLNDISEISNKILSNEKDFDCMNSCDKRASYLLTTKSQLTDNIVNLSPFLLCWFWSESLNSLTFRYVLGKLH